MPSSRTERGQYRPFFDVTRGLGAECLDDERRIAEHMSTADVARDLDLLRQAVGDRKLTYLGFSYGSYLGNTYANLFPHNVRALVIDGVLDPRLWSSGWQIKSDRVATQEEFDEFLRLCDEAGPDVRVQRARGLGGALGGARRQPLRATPLELPDGFVYTYDLLITDATERDVRARGLGRSGGRRGAVRPRSPTPCSATRAPPVAVAVRP